MKKKNGASTNSGTLDGEINVGSQSLTRGEKKRRNKISEEILMKNI